MGDDGPEVRENEKGNENNEESKDEEERREAVKGPREVNRREGTAAMAED